MQHLNDPDPFADGLESYFETGRGTYTLTRSDGLEQVEDAGVYFTTYSEFPLIEKRALRFARGRVLDIGCGAGRHALYWQRKGHAVTAIDASPRVAAIASARGVRDVRVARACERLPFRSAEFDTVLLFGNNLGLCGSRKSTAQLLRELGRVTRRDAHILCTTRAPGTLNHKHRSYWNERLAGGNEFGVVQFELGFRDKERKQVALFLIAPSNLMTLAWECGWRVQEIFAIGNPDDGYAAVLVKRRVSRGRALDF